MTTETETETASTEDENNEFDQAFAEFTAPASDEDDASTVNPAPGEAPKPEGEDDKKPEDKETGDSSKPEEDDKAAKEAAEKALSEKSDGEVNKDDKTLDKGKETGDTDKVEKLSLEERLTKAEHERDVYKHKQSSDAGRNRANQKRIDSLTQELDSAKEKLTAAEVAKQTSPEDLATLKEKSPALYNLIIEQGKQAQQPLNNRIAELEAQLAPVQEKIANTENATIHAEIAAKHGDWKEVIKSTGFKSWLETQDENVQGWYYDSPGSTDPIAVLDLYRIEVPTATPQKSEVEIAAEEAEKQKRKKQLESGAAVPNNSGAPQEIPDNDEYDATFAKVAADIEKRQKQT